MTAFSRSASALLAESPTALGSLPLAFSFNRMKDATAG